MAMEDSWTVKVSALSKAPGVAVGDSRAGHLSHEPRRTSEAAPTRIPWRIFGAEQDGLLNPQRTAGNQAVTRLLRPSRFPVHPDFRATAEEADADRSTGQVLGMPQPAPALRGQDHEPSHVRQEHPGAIGLPPVVREVVIAPGHPLDPATRGYMEPRFGWDFSRVRVDTDAPAAQSAQAVGARAYTVGRHRGLRSGSAIARFPLRAAAAGPRVGPRGAAARWRT